MVLKYISYEFPLIFDKGPMISQTAFFCDSEIPQSSEALVQNNTNILIDTNSASVHSK